MSNLQLLRSDIDVTPVLLELNRNPQLWDEITFRQDFPGSPHADTKTICLRMTSEFNKELPASDLVGANYLEASDFPAYDLIPSARNIVMPLMAMVGGERLGRVMIVKLSPGKGVDKHVDTGEYPKYYDRFHVALQSSPQGAIYRVGADTVRMRSGEIWWFQNLVEHETFNDSSIERINMIVDIKLRGHKQCP